MMIRVAEQVLGRKDAQENGTCATIMPLYGATLDDLCLKTYKERIQQAGPLTIEDLELTESESSNLQESLVHTIMNIIVQYGGEHFSQWREEVKERQPKSDETIPVHQTPIHPLPSMEIDESTITGNIDLIEAIDKELGVDEEDPKHIRIVAGDQLTIAQQQAILNIRVGHEAGRDSWKHVVLMPGLFHAKIADCHGVLFTHFGVSSIQSPGSLAFHNACLDRIPIVLTSLPSFRVSRELIMISLYARILHCLLLVSGTRTLEEYQAKFSSINDIKMHSQEILTRYANADIVHEYRELRSREERRHIAQVKVTQIDARLPTSGIEPTQLPSCTTRTPSSDSNFRSGSAGDMVFKNAVLFLRDSLLTRLFADAVKSGDSGIIIIVLKLWTFTYRGSGRTKYAYKMLHLFHNLINIWSKQLRVTIIRNWLLNPTGRKNAFVEIDLVQEHLNFWIKKIYKADGDAHSWDWLELVSPCIKVLRKLATKLNSEIGSKQGLRYSTPDLQKDLNTLMGVLREHEVYVFKKGRVLHPKDAPVPDVLSAGLAALSYGSTANENPLVDFNQQYNTMKEQRKLVPVSQVSSDLSNADITPTSPFVAVGNGPIPDTSQKGGSLSDSNLNISANNEGMGHEVYSPTLTRLDEDDVALEMDDWELNGEEESESEEERDTHDNDE